jgi:hypothetical protein
MSSHYPLFKSGSEEKEFMSRSAYKKVNCNYRTKNYECMKEYSNV